VTTAEAPEVRLRVAPPGRATDVVVGAGCLTRLVALIGERLPRARRWLVVVDRLVHAEAVWARWRCPWRPDPAQTMTVPAGEDAKTRAVHAQVEDAILEAGLTREDCVVAVGGGAAIDVAGYAAATTRRGLPWVAVPTSVVAQADAAVGGKTGVNHPRGKNLLGAFHAPALVVADVRTLSTLPARDRTAGLAEVFKAGFVGDAILAASLAERGAPEGEAAWVEAVSRALAVKAAVVEADERDEGPRRVLNYGHTVGHPLETLLGNHAMRHGEAVAIGMSVAAEVAARRGLFPREHLQAQAATLGRLAVPTRVPPAAATRRIIEVARADKKRRPGAEHVMVLPRAPQDLVVVEDVTDAELADAIEARRER
jgi:3-dehydroquinate synthetase